MFLCRENTYAADELGTRCSSTKDEPVETVSLASCNQEILDGNDKSRSKNDSMPSTSKQGIDPNNWKSQAGKKHHTYSGPLIPSNVHGNSFIERGRMSDRFSLFQHLSIFMSMMFVIFIEYDSKRSLLLLSVECFSQLCLPSTIIKWGSARYLKH